MFHCLLVTNTATMDNFELIDFPFTVRLPGRTIILLWWSNERFIGLFLYRGWTDVKCQAFYSPSCRCYLQSFSILNLVWLLDQDIWLLQVVQTYLQWTTIGPLRGELLCCNIFLWNTITWKVSGTPWSGHDVKWNCVMFLVSFIWNYRYLIWHLIWKDLLHDMMHQKNVQWNLSKLNLLETNFCV